MCNKVLKVLKKKKREMINTMTGVKNALERINSRIIAEEWISKLEDRMVKTLLWNRIRKKNE